MVPTCNNTKLLKDEILRRVTDRAHRSLTHIKTFEWQKLVDIKRCSIIIALKIQTGMFDKTD